MGRRAGGRASRELEDTGKRNNVQSIDMIDVDRRWEFVQISKAENLKVAEGSTKLSPHTCRPKPYQ